MFFKGITILFATLALDQLYKGYIIKAASIIVAPFKVTSFFNLVMVWNPGISFGMFQDLSYGKFIFAGIAGIIVIIMLFWLKKTNSLFMASAIGLIAGGAIGNTIDRIRYGAVVDFFDFHVAGYHWPAFNIADSAITIGAIMLCIDSIFYNEDKNDVKK